MIDKEEIERCRRMLVAGSFFAPTVGLLLHPVCAVTGVLVMCWMWVLWLGMQDGGWPRWFEKWSACSDRNHRITIVLATALTWFFVSVYVISCVYFLFRLLFGFTEWFL